MGASRLYSAIFLISALGIAYQIVLMRVFSIAQWHHFAYMIISIAMLGFGASGTLLVLLRQRIRGREAPLLKAAAFLLVLSLPGCYIASQYIPFETFELATQRGQLRHLFLLYLVLAAPFFCVSTCITLGFFLAPHTVARLYGVNMLGSGAGALAVIGMLFLWDAALLPYVLMIPAGVALGILMAEDRRTAAAGLAVTLAILLAACLLPRVPVHVSQYKGLSYTLQFPDAEVLGEKFSPLSRITAVRSSLLRETPGQISNYPMEQLGDLPPQIGLFFDAGGASPVHRFTGDLEPLRFLDYVTASVAFRLVDQPSVLVVGAGGGTDVLNALLHGARAVTAVEVDPRVFEFVQEDLGEFSGRLYSLPGIRPVVGDGRGFLQAHHERYDLIQIALLDSFNASAAGVHALSESYLYTLEAFQLYLDRLTDNGVLAITRWLQSPPRDPLKMFATMVEAAERAGIAQPARHLVFIRSWNTATLLLSKSPLKDEQIAAVRSFCTDRWFDLVHLPGMQPEEANQYVVLEQPEYYTFAQRVLGPDRDHVYQDAFFYLRPATDDRPYFFRFFRWSSLPEMFRGMGMQWVPFVEWGYIALVATLMQGLVASALFILLPLITLARRPTAQHAKRWVVAYALALGLGFMFLELAFIQKFMLFLAYPVYAVAVVLTAFLVFSGCGSLYANRIRTHRARALAVLVALMCVLVAGYLIALPAIFNLAAAWPDPFKIALSILLLAPLAFLMGIPFPMGLQLLNDTDDALLPWAWGINGCASVVGASLATFLAVHAGFQWLVLLALLIYATAAGSLRKLEGP